MPSLKDIRASTNGHVLELKVPNIRKVCGIINSQYSS
jgi:hypothetical protein